MTRRFRIVAWFKSRQRLQRELGDALYAQCRASDLMKRMRRERDDALRKNIKLSKDLAIANNVARGLARAHPFQTTFREIEELPEAETGR